MTILPKNSTIPTHLWQKDLQSAFRKAEDLLDFLQLKAIDCPYSLALEHPFPFLVTPYFASQMRADWFDPLLLQVLPRSPETHIVEGFLADAVGDLAAQKAPGLLHKYASRVLLLSSVQCAIHCRYCFRREFPYGELPKTKISWEAAFDYIEAHPQVNEVILSGGDPLFADNQRLGQLIDRLRENKQIETLRIHTRLPIVLPSRIDEGLLQLLEKFTEQKSCIMVVHSNHAQELGIECATACKKLRHAGVTLLNQSVLLRHINDTVSVLNKLSQRLLQIGVMPYYLHQLDKVNGTAHFEVPVETGKKLMEELRLLSPGYGVPRYVQEIQGEGSKTPL